MSGNSQRIYLDYASATPLLKDAFTAMNHAERCFANPGSIHQEGVAAKKLLEEARTSIAHELGAKSGQVVFTSGLSESNNLAILGFARRLEMSGTALHGTHWITSSIEHSSVLEPFAEIERRGGTVTHLKPDERGLISGDSLKHALRAHTVFVSIGWANNEIGVVQPLSELSRVIRAHASKSPIIFHTDAGQAPLYISAHVHTFGVDAMSLGAGKLYGPRSSGALYVEDASRFASVIVGGNQEKGLRAGTEDVVPAVGFAKAFEAAARDRGAESKRLSALRDELAVALRKCIPELMVNGSLPHALPHMLNISIPNINAEYMVLALDREGIALSTRSACNADKALSHVVEALGGPDWRARNTLRISLGRATTPEDVARASETVAALVPLSGT